MKEARVVHQGKPQNGTHVTALRPEEIKSGILEDFVGMYLRVAYEAAYADFTARLGPDALKPGYFTILTLIVNNAGISQTQICTAAGRDKSGVAKALRWMEDAGLINRIRPEHDRRAQYSEATEKGRAMQKRMEEKAHTHLAALNAAVGEDRRKAFIETLQDFIKNLPSPPR